MKISLPLLTIAVLIAGCCGGSSSGSSGQSSNSSDAADSLSQLSAVSPATTMKENASRVTATIESIVPLDEHRYRISIRISQTNPAKASIVSLVEAGQQITVTPQYVLDEDGVIESQNPRNEHLRSLRAAKVGDSFVGIVSRSHTGKWVLVDVEQ